jgi:hypothetical protein
MEKASANRSSNLSRSLSLKGKQPENSTKERSVFSMISPRTQTNAGARPLPKLGVIRDRVIVAYNKELDELNQFLDKSDQSETPSRVPVDSDNAGSEKSSAEVAPIRPEETIETRPSEVLNSQTLVRSSRRNLVNVITLKKKDPMSGARQPDQILEQSSSSDEPLFTSGTHSPRRFPGMAELPQCSPSALPRSAKKRDAYRFGKQQRPSLSAFANICLLVRCWTSTETYQVNINLQDILPRMPNSQDLQSKTRSIKK